MTWLRRLGRAVVDNVTNLMTILTLDGRAFRQKISLLMTVLQYFEPFIDEEKLEGRAAVAKTASG